MLALEAYVPAFCVDFLEKITDNVGTMVHDADISCNSKRHRTAFERLQAAGLGAFFRPGQVEQAGITRDQLRTLVRRGQVEHIARGLYRFTGVEPTENYSLGMVCARVPNSIVCLLSALRVHENGT